MTHQWYGSLRLLILTRIIIFFFSLRAKADILRFLCHVFTKKVFIFFWFSLSLLAWAFAGTQIWGVSDLISYLECVRPNKNESSRPPEICRNFQEQKLSSALSLSLDLFCVFHFGFSGLHKNMLNEGMLEMFSTILLVIHMSRLNLGDNIWSKHWNNFQHS